MEIVDFEGQFEKQIENETRDREGVQEDLYKRIDDWNSSMDRRQDKVWSDIHTLHDKVSKLDSTVNPNMDLLK
jgi:flagellar capping protein FliD